MNIAILGANGHIAKNLIYHYCNNSQVRLFLYARNLVAVDNFLKDINCTKEIAIFKFDEFKNHNYDVVINCVGLGTPGRLKNEILSIFKLTEHYDNLIIEYLTSHNYTLYINLSSGAAYGVDFSEPVNDSSVAKFNINNLQSEEYYGLAKLCSEAKHRALQSLNIVDLRIFGFFSRFIDLEKKFLISEIITCIKSKKELTTGSVNIIRDYIYPADFMQLIALCINQRKINDVFDVYSLKYISKFEMLDYFHEHYGLQFIIQDEFSTLSATGIKNNYYSTNKRAEAIGFRPKLTSLDVIINESRILLSNLEV